ncbi:MAG: membrane protein of unknown function [Promethearchaeota archaeon]|nr:MAG: membrane protein of unknown function [Candidatus Lokiarchaeota archaeon]
MLEIILADLLCFAIIFIVSSVIMLPKRKRTYWSIMKYIGFIGVIIHELCHYIITFITGLIPEKIHIEFYRQGSFGYVRAKAKSFSEAFLTAYAPIILITWLELSLYSTLITVQNIFLFFFILFIMLSAIIYASPSYPDVVYPLRFIKEHPAQSLYELLIALESFFIASHVVVEYKLIFPHTFYYYLIIAAFYLAQIWIIKGIIYTFRKIQNKIRSKRDKTVLYEKRLEAQW